MKKRLLPMFAVFALVFAAGCGDDEGADTDDTTETTAEATTTTEAPEALALDDWVEQADEICADADDSIDDLPGETAEEAAEAIPDAVEIAEGQLSDLQALGLPDEEADTVEEALALLEDQLEVLQGMAEAAEDGEDPETIFEDAQADSEELIADLEEIAEELGLEDCGSDGSDTTTTTTGSGEPFTYGDDPELDALWDACADGDAEACDELWSSAPVDSDYEQFGYSCGGIVPEGEAEICSEVLNAGGEGGDIPATGDPVIDQMLEACLAGNGVACDQAYALTEAGSEAEAFADTCGGTADAGTICSPEMGGSKVIEPEVSTGFTYGDDPDMDAVQDACADGDMAQCDLLFLTSPIDSDYELFGGTCGELFTPEESPYSCVAGE